MYIVGQGAVTALGHDAQRTVASLRSGLDGFIEQPFTGVSGLDLKTAPVRGFAEGLSGAGPYEALAVAALRPCIDLLRRLAPKRPVVFLGLPRRDRPGVPQGLAAVVQARLEREFDLPRGCVRVIEEGRVSAFMGLRHAQELLQSGAEGCVVGGVDCLVNPASLMGLSEQGSLVEEYDGFFPGQGASFVCLSRGRGPGPWGGPAARIAGVDLEDEKAEGTAEDPLVGNAIRRVFQSATEKADLEEADLGIYINSVNGSRSEFEDDAMAQIKFFRSPREYLEIWHLASYLGETGAAYGAVSLIWAAAAAELGFAQRQATLVTATEARWRAAACVTASGKPGSGLSLHVPCLHSRRNTGLSIPAADDPGIRLDDDDLHAELATRNLDEIAALLLIRDGHLQDGSPWSDIEGFEQRLLAHYDAVLWHGGAFHDIAMELTEDGEPENAAAAAMVLCGASATDEEIDAVLELCGASEDHLRMVLDTVALTPKHVAHQVLLKALKVDPAHEAAALRGLSQAGWLDLALAKSHATVVSPEARVPLIVGIGAAHHQGLHAVVDALMRAPAKVTDPLAWLAALAVLPVQHVQQLLGTEDGLEFAPQALASCCIKGGWSLLRGVESKPRTPGLVTALGHSGEVQSADLLLEALGEDDDDLRAASALALNRIFGCDLYEEVVVEEEDDAFEEVESLEDDEEAPDDPLEEDEETAEVLVQDPDQWRSAIARLRTDKSARLRRGRRLVPDVLLHDLLLERPCYAEREIGVLEYVALAGKPAPMHPRQLVALQRARLPK